MRYCELCGRASNNPRGSLWHENGYHKRWLKRPALLIQSVQVEGRKVRVCAECVTKTDLDIQEHA